MQSQQIFWAFPPPNPPLRERRRETPRVSRYTLCHHGVPHRRGTSEQPTRWAPPERVDSRGRTTHERKRLTCFCSTPIFAVTSWKNGTPSFTTNCGQRLRNYSPYRPSHRAKSYSVTPGRILGFGANWPPRPFSGRYRFWTGQRTPLQYTGGFGPTEEYGK